MEVIIEETDDSEHGIVITGGKLEGLEALSGSVQRKGPAVVAYGQVLGNLVSRSNERLEEHRDWLANLPRLEVDDTTPLLETLEPSTVSVSTTTTSTDHGVITPPPTLAGRQISISTPPLIPGLPLCGSSVSVAVASAVAAASAEAQNSVNAISLAAQQSVSAAEKAAQASAAAAISAIQISASLAIGQQPTTSPASPRSTQPTTSPAPPRSTITSTITSIVSLTTTVSALTTLPATTLSATTVSATITITLSGTEVPGVPIPVPATTITAITSIKPGNGPPGSSSTAVGGGGVVTSLGVSASSAIASLIASASAAIASANSEASSAKSSASLVMQQAQSSISSISSQATMTVQTIRTIADKKLLFALVVTFSIIGSSIVSILLFFLITRCLRRRREKKQGIRVADMRDSQETMFRRATAEPVAMMYGPTGFGNERRSVSRGRRSLSRGANGSGGGIRELPPGLPGNIVGFIVDENRGQRGEMMERSRSTPPTNGDSPTRGRAFDNSFSMLPRQGDRSREREEQGMQRRNPSRKNTLTYDPDRPNSPPLFGLAGGLNERLSRLSKLDIPTMPTPPGPLNQNTSDKSAGGMTSAGGYSRGDHSAGGLSRGETPREVKFTDSAFSAFGTESSYRGVSSAPSLPNRSTTNTIGRLSTLPSLRTMPDSRSTATYTRPSTLDPRASGVGGEEVPIGLEVEPGLSPSDYSVGGVRELKDGRIENVGGRIESSKGEIMGGGGGMVGLDVLREATNRRLREKQRKENGDEEGSRIGTAV